MDYELQFLIMVNLGNGKSIFDLLASQLLGADVRTARSLDFGQNNISVHRNEFADVLSSENPKDEYLDYPVRIEVIPIAPNVTVEHQVAAARQLSTFFEKHKIEAVVCADFEHLL